MNYRFDDLAIADINAISDYYSITSRDLAANFIDELYRQIQLIRENPESGAPIGGIFRRSLLKRFPYAIIYEVEAPTQTIFIVTVGHQHRHPEYWRNRVQENSCVYRLAA
jgi:toxin ParE1/3/4